jgi:hypothetical protein
MEHVKELAGKDIPIPRLNPSQLYVTQPLPSNGYFSGPTILTFSRHATIYEFTLPFDAAETRLFIGLLNKQ